MVEAGMKKRLLPRYRVVAFFFCLFLTLAFVAQAAEMDGSAAERQDPLQTLGHRIEALEEELDYYRKEQEARQALMPTEQAEKEEERTADVLRASEEEATKYVLLRSRTIEFRYSLNYQHSTYDKIVPNLIDIERETYYNFVNSLSISYGLMPRLSISASIPFIYKYQKSGESREESDLGDVSVGLSFQILREEEYRPAMLMSLGYSAPTGRSPFLIDTTKELSTGSGTHGVSLGLNLSKTLDPVVAFGGVGFAWTADITGINQQRAGATLREVSPGYGISYSMGLGFALSYSTSVTFRFSASHSARSKYTLESGGRYRQFESDESSSASFIIGTGWRISPKTSLNISLGYGLVGIEDYSLYFSLPFDFTL